MQETTPVPQFLRLRVWALTVAFAASAFVVGLLSLAVHLLKVHRRVPGPFPGGMGGYPGGRPQPWPAPSGAAQPWGGGMYPHALGAHPMMAHHGVLLALLLIVIFAIVAGIAGSIVAAVYNALLPKA